MAALTEKNTEDTLKLIRQGASLAHSPLLNLAAVRQHMRQRGGETANPEIALYFFIDEVITKELEGLRTDLSLQRSEDSRQTLIQDFHQGSPALEAWSALYYRFLHPKLFLQVQEIAQITGNNDKYIQRRLKMGIQRLTIIIIRLEEEATHHIADQRRRLLVNLPGITTSGLVNRAEELKQISTILHDRNKPWAFALEGIGGVGKTALAYIAIEECIHDHVFVDIACVTAKRKVFRGQRIEALSTPILTLERFLDELIIQLKFGEAVGLSENAKISLLQRKLHEAPYLIVIDNLETSEDYQGIASLIADLTTPTKILITSRIRLNYDYISPLELNPLMQKETFQLVHKLASDLHLDLGSSFDEQQLSGIYEVTGGNPLAIKLVVGLLAYYPSVQDAVRHLLKAKEETVDEFYRFIYQESWQRLSPAAQDILYTLPLYEIGGTKEAILNASQLDELSFSEGMAELIRFSLVQVSGSVNNHRYFIHSLTRRFVLSEVAKEWSL